VEPSAQHRRDRRWSGWRGDGVRNEGTAHGARDFRLCARTCSGTNVNAITVPVQARVKAQCPDLRVNITIVTNSPQVLSER
jgi:hypothetical protein